MATDRSMGMTRSIGPATTDPDGSVWAAQADWLALPLPDASCDVVLSDGGFANVPAVHGGARARPIPRWCRPEAACTTRMFVRPDDREDPDQVWRDLVDGRLGTFAAFKLRLLMALSGDDGDVCVADGWECFRSQAADIDALADHLGWDPAAIRTIEAYRGQRTVYGFPTGAQFGARCPRWSSTKTAASRRMTKAGSDPR